MKDRKRLTATLEQVQSGLEALTDDEYLRLRHIAKRVTVGTSYLDPQDLVHDAFKSVLESRRLWNLEYTFFSFLCGAMKGIASNDRGSLRTRTETVAAAHTVPDEIDNDSVLVYADAQNQLQYLLPKIGAEEALENLERRAAALYALFVGDEEITMMFMAMEDGCRGEDIQRQCDMTSMQYQAARKRMNRRLDAAFPNRRDLR